MVPEDTFQPQSFQAVVCDLSERGAMISADLPEATYRKLLHATRYCRLEFLDEPDLPDRVIGKAVYIQPVSKQGRVEYRIGLFFEEVSAQTAENLRRFVAKTLDAQLKGPPQR